MTRCRRVAPGPDQRVEQNSKRAQQGEYCRVAECQRLALRQRVQHRKAGIAKALAKVQTGIQLSSPRFDTPYNFRAETGSKTAQRLIECNLIPNCGNVWARQRQLQSIVVNVALNAFPRIQLRKKSSGIPYHSFAPPNFHTIPCPVHVAHTRIALEELTMTVQKMPV